MRCVPALLNAPLEHISPSILTVIRMIHGLGWAKPQFRHSHQSLSSRLQGRQNREYGAVAPHFPVHSGSHLSLARKVTDTIWTDVPGNGSAPRPPFQGLSNLFRRTWIVHFGMFDNLQAQRHAEPRLDLRDYFTEYVSPLR